MTIKKNKPKEAKSDFYPDLKRLFSAPVGKPLKYTPEQIRKEFEAYIADLKATPIRSNTNIKRCGAQGSEEKSIVNIYPTPPRLADFITRWLGASWRWWAETSKSSRGEEFSKIKAQIKEYCEGAMLNGAMCGLYKENLVSRYLGLAEHTENAVTAKQQVDMNTRYSVDDIPEELLYRLADAMQDKANGKGTGTEKGE